MPQKGDRTMKKPLALTLALAMLFTLAACAGGVPAGLPLNAGAVNAPE